METTVDKERSTINEWMKQREETRTRLVSSLQPASTQCVTTTRREHRLRHGAGGDVRASVAGWRCRCRVTVWLWRRWHLTACACAGRYIKQHCRVTLRTIHSVIHSNSKLCFNWIRENHKWTKNHFNTPCHSQLAITSIYPITISTAPPNGPTSSRYIDGFNIYYWSSVSVLVLSMHKFLFWCNVVD